MSKATHRLVALLALTAALAISLPLGLRVLLGSSSGGGASLDDPPAAGATIHRTRQKKLQLNLLRRRQRQRVVVLAGPHKSASTSVQIFLMELLKRKLLLPNWKWPGIKHHKGFARLARSMAEPMKGGETNSKWDDFEKAVKKGWDKGQSLVMAAEAFDMVAALAEREARAAVRRLAGTLYGDGSRAFDAMEVVVMYRTPRSSHLISAWKQQVAMALKNNAKPSPWRRRIYNLAPPKKSATINVKTSNATEMDATSNPPSLADFLCHARWDGWVAFDVTKIILAQLNPMGVANAYHRHGNANITIMDMSGVEGGDIPSALACDVLNLPCRGGKVLGVKGDGARVENQRSAETELGMSDEELEEAEEILRKMDCYYYCRLKDEGLVVLHGKDEMFVGDGGWRGCCTNENGNVDAAEAAGMLRKLGCRASGQNRQLSSSRISFY